MDPLLLLSYVLSQMDVRDWKKFKANFAFFPSFPPALFYTNLQDGAGNKILGLNLISSAHKSLALTSSTLARC